MSFAGVARYTLVLCLWLPKSVPFMLVADTDDGMTFTDAVMAGAVTNIETILPIFVIGLLP